MTAYWVALVTVTDPRSYANYQALAQPVLARFGARFLARGGTSEVLEGPVLERHVIIEFPSIQAARECYHSPEYQAARAARAGACTVHVVLVEACPAPGSADAG